MTSPEKWICDGIPKNKKFVASAGEAHDPHENCSTDCDICGLPKESSIEPSKPLPVKAIFMAIAGLLIIGGSGAAYSLMTQGCEAKLEKIDGQCIDPFLQPYQVATEQGDEAILLAKDYQSITDLEKAHLSLNDVIKQLDLIPTEALIYSKVGTRITEYKRINADISSNLDREKVALAKLQESKKIAEEAKNITSGNRTVAELKSANQKWSEAQSLLQAIDLSSLVAKQAEQHLTDYEREIKGIDSRIAAMTARRSVPTRSTYKAPKKTYKPVRKKKYYPPKKQKVNSDSCAENKSSNCLF